MSTLYTGICVDLTNNRNNGKPTGTFSGGVFTPTGLALADGPLVGRRNFGVSFNGTTGNLLTQPNTALYPPQFSFECWFRTTSTASLQLIGGRAAGGYSINLAGTANYYINTAYYGIFSSVTSNNNAYAPDGKWRHLVVTHDQVNMKYYINGALNKSSANTSSMIPVNVGIGVGCYNNNGTITGRFGGDMLLPTIYNRALTAAEVAENYNAGINGPMRSARRHRLISTILKKIPWQLFFGKAA